MDDVENKSRPRPCGCPGNEICLHGTPAVLMGIEPTHRDEYLGISRMSYATKVIGKYPRDGREWDCQCARCGSSMSFEDCDNCGGEGWIEDDDWQADEGDGWDCEWCHGEGGHHLCLASSDWCEANPIDGRSDTKRGTVEWFTFEVKKGTA